MVGLVAVLDRLGPALTALADAGLLPAAEAASLKAEVVANRQKAHAEVASAGSSSVITVGNSRRTSVSSASGRRNSLISSV